MTKKEKSLSLEEIIKIYREKIQFHEYEGNTAAEYEHIYKHTPIARAGTITEFVSTITTNDIQNQEEFIKTSFYIHALIDKSPDEEHLIRTEHLAITMDTFFKEFRSYKRVIFY